MNKQASIEELKECREAFEQWMQDTYGYVPEPNTVYREGTYLSKRDDDRWIAYQAGQNRRTEPAPAEVPERIGYSALMQMASDAGLGPAHVSGVIQVRLEKFGRAVEQYARQALSQHPPSRVEGELMDEQIVQCLRDANLLDERKHQLWYETGPYDITRASCAAISFARAIERALNQRLAGKVGEVVAWLDERGEVFKADASMVEAESWGWTPLYTHPVSDDQQAKDAARYHWLRKYNFNNRWTDEEIDREIERDKAIALSTTKQEESK